MVKAEIERHRVTGQASRTALVYAHDNLVDKLVGLENTGDEATCDGEIHTYMTIYDGWRWRVTTNNADAIHSDDYDQTRSMFMQMCDQFIDGDVE